MAFDPTSVRGTGAFLADRLRMKDADEKGIFFESMAHRGYSGGIARAAAGAAYVLEGLGKGIKIEGRGRPQHGITGSKMWITNGPVAYFVTVAATTDPAKRLDGLGFFLVEKGTPGFSVGQKIEKISARGANTAELIFDGCRIPEENFLGLEGKGAQHLNDILSEIRTMIAGLGLGLSKASFAAGLKYAGEREVLAAASGTSSSSRKRSRRWSAHQGHRSSSRITRPGQGSGVPTGKEAAMAKLYSTETACFVGTR